MNLVAGYKNLKEIYIVLNVEFAQKLSVSGQGVKGLESHAKSAKHRERLPKPVGSAISFPSSSKTSQPVETSALKQTNIVDANAKQLATKAEIMWSIDVVLSNYSFKCTCMFSIGTIIKTT